MCPPSRTSALEASKVPCRFTRNDILRNIISLVCKACTTYQKQTLAVVFVLLETISIILDIFGTDTWDFSVASFLISAFGFVMTLYSAFFIGKGIWNRITEVEIVFSFTQLIVAYIDLVMKILRIKINCNYKASAFPLAFAIIVLVYAFKTKKKSPPSDFSVSSVPKWDGSPPTEPTNTDLIDSLPIPERSGSTGQIQAMADLPGSSLPIVESPRIDGLDGVSKDSLDKDNQYGLKQRKTEPSWTEKVKVSAEDQHQGAPDDGYSWRKYGEKHILGAKYPRSYYRCVFKHTQGCSARKHVQRSDEDPSIVEVKYIGTHTCSSESSPSRDRELVVETELKLE